VVRTSPNSLSFSSPTALHQIYGSRAVNIRKTKFYNFIDSPSGASTTHTEIDKEKHAARRRILSHAFSDTALKEAEVFVLDNVKKFVRLLGPDREEDKGEPGLVAARWGEPRNMSDWCNWLAYDIMGNLVFGKSYNCRESEEHRRMPVVMTEGMKFAYWVS
jgi:cytochrome P450